jgi:hypothetical protein
MTTNLSSFPNPLDAPNSSYSHGIESSVPTPNNPYALSPWLSAYVAFSRKWSPRACEGFHVACALWLLSTVAARRVVLYLGKAYYTPLFLALVARSGLYAKSTTTSIALDTLAAARLDWLLAADNSTPRRFIHDLSLHLPSNYDVLTAAQRERLHNRLALTSQRGWFYDEFGQQLAALGHARGSLADFRSLLLRLDDCKETYEYATFTHSPDVLHRPYLALLANLTPADMQRSARLSAPLWNDGFWARFAFVCPPALDDSPAPARFARFPAGKRAIPPELSTPLRTWHQRLGMPKLEISFPLPCADPEPTNSGTHERTGNLPSPQLDNPSPPLLNVESVEPVACTLAEGVEEAYYAHQQELLNVAEQNNIPDLDASYSRLAEKALRVAMLIASLENGNHIELGHWSLGHHIAEEWRTNLHTLYDQLKAAPPAPAPAEQQPPQEKPLDERVLTIVRRHPGLTANEIAHYVRGLSPNEAVQVLDELLFSGRIECYVESRSLRYQLPTPSDIT